ncbi:MAG: hypothetical protein ACHQRM_12270 [Bacteroidia bacterium]
MAEGFKRIILNTWFQKLFIAGCILFISLGLYWLLQQPDFYHNTLGRITHTYEHAGSGRNVKIVEVDKPFEKWRGESIYHWDAALYDRIRAEGYVPGSVGAKEKLAFYPLFPWLWKITKAGPRGVLLMNYLLFTGGLLLLMSALLPSGKQSSFLFTIAMLLPPAVNFYLPYAEALFLFTFSLGVWGIMKGKYWIFAIGVFLACMARPSALIFMLSLLAADGVYLLIHRNIRHFVREFLLKILPCLAGFAVVTIVQYSYSGSWDAYFDSLELWPSESGLFNTIRDWSREGFGMSVFAIFFVSIPCVFAVITWAMLSLKGKKKAEPLPLFGSEPDSKRDYLWYLSLLFISANLAYTILVSGNCMNGYSRYTLAVPFFYIVFFLLPGKLLPVSPRMKALAFSLCLAGLVFFLSQVVYGGNRFAFAYDGLYLLLILTIVILAQPFLSLAGKWIILGILILPCIVWQLYLFNMFLSDAWIFT